MNSKEYEVERLKNLVKDLELQNSALRSKQSSNSTAHQHEVESKHLARRSISSDGERDFLDLSVMEALDDDTEWLYSSPQPNLTASLSENLLKKKKCLVFESPEVLPRRRALSHKLRDIERGTTALFPLTNGSYQQSAPSAPVVSDVSSTPSPGHSHTSDSQSSANTSTEQTPEDKDVLQYMNSVLEKAGQSSDLTAESSFAECTSPELASAPEPSSAFKGYSTGTFTRPKKKTSSTINQDLIDNCGASSSSSASSLRNGHSLASDSHHDTPNKYKRASRKPRDSAMSAGDSGTYTLARNKTHTIDSSTVLEAQKRLTDSSSSLDQSDSDSVGVLPGNTFRRRTGKRQEDKPKRESLDIQTLAKLQEQSLRDSLTAVRKASTSSNGSTGVPGLNFSDLDSSTGSLSSSNEEAFHQSAEQQSKQGSGTFRIRKSSGKQNNASPTMEHNGDTPILHKSVVTSKAKMPDGRQSPQIKSSLSPRSLVSPKTSGLRKPNSTIPGKTKPRTGGIPVPASRTSLRPPMGMQYSSR